MSISEAPRAAAAPGLFLVIISQSLKWMLLAACVASLQRRLG
jgi:hypothetical protein